MSVLELIDVRKRSGSGSRFVLDGVSLAVAAGEMVTVWGERRSGRSTLLRLAAGIERPDNGVVRFAGQDLAHGRQEMLGGGISFCRKSFRGGGGRTVLDQLVGVQLARRVPPKEAEIGAWAALERAGAADRAALRPAELDTEEAVRVGIARALTARPRLLVVDEPTIGVDSLLRDGLLELLRSLADDGIAVLASTGEGTGVLGSDRVLSLGGGKLRGEIAPRATGLAAVAHLGSRRRARG